MRALALVALLAGFAGCGSTDPAPPPTPSFVSCREFVGSPARAGSIYYEHAGIAVNLPAGKFCEFPDGTTVGADR